MRVGVACHLNHPFAAADKRWEKQMANQETAIHGVMEGGGSYNLHARIPAGGGILALPFLEQAVRNVPLNSGEQPVVIADYGSSQGKNSLAPMRAAIKALRARLGPERPILVVHIDQAANDFNTLFEVLHSDPERYCVDDANIFPSAIGRSFYESVLPREHVHLGWSSYAAVWLSRIPMLIPDHFIVLASAGDVREAFERQAADDWRFFLSLRASELRLGGRLVVVLPGLNDEGAAGFELLFDQANGALSEMVAEGAISTEERAGMVLGAYPRRRSELLAPFNTDGQFRGLTVEHCELSVLPDAAWADYEQDANREVLATRHARFFRSIFVPSLASAICGEGQRNVFPDRLEEKLKRRLAERPVPLHSFVQTIVLAKQGCTSTPAVQN
jgi:SAM dependent carboxyl methyltransferase